MKKVIILHGFNKSSRDMKVLQRNLERCHLDCFLIDLPLTFKSIEHCAYILEDRFEKIANELHPKEKLSLVGHSSGGLVIRKFLSVTKQLDRVHKCVFIATPNQGSSLADLAGKLSKTFTFIFKTLDSLRTENIQNLQIKLQNVEMGAIAGNKNNLLLGKLLKGVNDGRVEIQSVHMEGLSDFVVIPYGHKDIHYQAETADLIYKFIETSSFT